MGSSILPLHQTACTVVVRTLLDRSDPHSEENRRTGKHLVKQLESNVFTSVSGDVLKMFVKRYPSRVSSDLVLLLAPPHLRVLDLTRCHKIGTPENDLQVLRKAFSKCMHLKTLILDNIRRSDGYCIETLMEAIVDTAPQLMSISLEHMSIMEDEHVHMLLRGLPHLTSLKLSKCAGLTDDVFYLGQNQLSELAPFRDFILPGSHLASVDLSGCQKLTNTCIRHLLELCGPNLRNLNVSYTGMDCTVLWYLSGYSLSSTVQLALKSINQVEPYTVLAVKQLLQTLNASQKRLDEIKRGTLVDGPQGASSDVGTLVQDNPREVGGNRESSVTSETASKKQIDGMVESSTVSESETDECQDAAAGSSCPPSLASSDTDTAAARDEVEDLDSVVTSQLDALDISSGANLVVSRDTEVGQSGLTSELGIDPNIQFSMCSATYNGPNMDTRQDRNICGIEDVILEMDSGEQTQERDDMVNTNANVKLGEASMAQDQANSGACDLLNSSRSDQLHNLEDENDKVHVTADRNMNVKYPSNVNMQCQFCCHNNRTHRLGKTGSANEILEQKGDSGETGTLPTQPDIQVGITSEMSVSDTPESRCSGINQNQRTALNSSFPKPMNKDSSSALGSNCNLCHDTPSSCFGVEDNTNTSASSFTPTQSLVECSEHISCGKSGQNVSLDAVPLPCEGASECSGFSASSTASRCVMETTDLCGDEGSLQMNKASVSSSSQTLHVEATAVCCAIETKDSNLSGAGSSSLSDGVTNTAGSPVNMQSTMEVSDDDDTLQAGTSSEPREGLDPSLPAAMQTLPRLFEPYIVSLDISFIDWDHAVVASCLEDFFSVNRHLQKLVLSQKGLTNATLEIISKNVKELRHYSMFDCPEISNEGLASFLKGCPKLQHLDIQGLSHVGDQGIYPLFEDGANSRLSAIKLAENSIMDLTLSATCITDITLYRIATTVGPKLQELVLLWCEDVTDAGLEKIALNCPSLKTLLLRQRFMRSETLQAFADNCPNLEDVGLSSVSCIAGDLMESVAPRLKRLKILDVSWNADLTNQSVSAILSSCPVLSELLLCGVKQITDKPFLSIIANYSKWKRCQILIQLKVREQKLRRDTGMAQLSSDEEFEDLYVPHRSTSYAPSLCDLNLSYCDHVKDNRLQEIVAVCRGTLNIVDYYGEDIAPKLLHSL
eukprot:XP_011664163.1 PREDICTED: uncharacterized protein LOC755050 [Strongylocentrotus purpuratus]